MFQFPEFPLSGYVFTKQYLESVQVGFPIRKSVDHKICAPPHGLSQLIASFIGSQCQGIRPMLLFA